jgi:NAD+ kinase
MRLAAELLPRTGGPLRVVALNEVVVQRGLTQGMLTVGLSVDGDWVADYRADGLIVATPSGSTAHSLSAGGPILFPSMLALVVTPICPQGLAARPIVMPPDTQLSVRLAYASGMTTLVADGQTHYQMEIGDRVLVERHPEPYPLHAMPELDPSRRLRERLGWSKNVGDEPRD